MMWIQTSLETKVILSFSSEPPLWKSETNSSNPYLVKLGSTGYCDVWELLFPLSRDSDFERNNLKYFSGYIFPCQKVGTN
jgi:hypothetical protein